MRFHTIALIILAICVAILLDYATDEPVTLTLSSELTEQDYDYYIEDIDSMHYSFGGNSDYRLQAKRATHYPNPDHSLLEKPYVVLYQGTELPWFVSAESGRVEKDVALGQDKVELIDNVIIHFVDSEGQAVDIYTDFLTIYPNTNKLNTDHDVIIKSPGAEISVHGISADLALNQIKLLADFRGRFYE